MNRSPITSKNGFTLIELVITICVLVIIMSISAMSIAGWQHASTLKENNTIAKSLYYATQSAITYHETNGEWNENMGLQAQVSSAGDTYKAGGFEFSVLSSVNAYQAPVLLRLLSNSIADTTVLNEPIYIYIDYQNANVHRVYYCPGAQGFSQSAGTNVPGGIIYQPHLLTEAQLNDLSIGFYGG